MAKPTYLVTVIHKGREADFHELRERGVTPDAFGALLAAGHVGFVEPIRASNRREALVLARAHYPGHVIGPRIVKQPTAHPRHT